MNAVEGESKCVRTEKSILVMSCLTAFSSETTSTDLFTLVLSPVRMAWSTRKLLEETESNRQSAGILSPTATVMMSPGTNSDAWMRANWEDRRTFASSGEYSLRAYKRKKKIYVTADICIRNDIRQWRVLHWILERPQRLRLPQG